MEKISFVIPCYGSENTIEYVVSEIRETIAQRPQFSFEIIAVNDCSPDRVYEKLLALAADDKRVKVINFAKNMNRPGAVMAGLNNASGKYVVVMDDDGQCPMDHFWELFQPIEEGHDVAIAKYPERKQSAFKNFGTFVNKKMTEFIINRPKDMEFTNFMILRSYIVDEIIKYKNPYPFFTGLILRTTNDIINVNMEERDRISGSSTFTFGKMLGMWVNGLTAFSIKPLRISSLVGVICAVIGFVFGVVTIIRKLVSTDVSVGWSSTISIMLFIGGLIMLMLGMIGEYLGRIYISLNDSPQFVIKEKINFDGDDDEE